MFELGWSELLVIAVVAIVVIGPKDLPRAMRFVGQWTGKMKRMARDFQGQFNEAMREAELDEVKKNVKSLAKMDPLAGVRKELASVDASARKLDAPKVTPKPAVAPASAAAATPPAASEPVVPVAEPETVSEAKP